MATFKVTKVIKITSKVEKDVYFKPYKQNFTYTLKGFGVLELRTNQAEKSLYYYKAILPYADVEMIDDFDREWYSITVSVENGTYTGPDKIDFGGNAKIEIQPNAGYELPETVTVNGAQYIYNDGVISLRNPSDDVQISAQCVASQFSITGNITNGALEGDTTIAVDGTATVNVEPTFGYAYSASDFSQFSVTNATISNYSNGVLTLSNPTGNVVVEYTCFPFDLQVSPVIDATTVGEKHAADLQENLEFSTPQEENERLESTASGTLLYVSDYSTAFSGDYTSGNYIMIVANATQDATLTVRELNNDEFPVVQQGDVYVLYLESISNTIQVIATIGNQQFEERISCSDLTFNHS